VQADEIKPHGRIDTHVSNLTAITSYRILTFTSGFVAGQLTSFK